MRLIPTTRHINKEGCCTVRDCWATATAERTRYGSMVVIDYCARHALQARTVFGADTQRRAA